MIINKTFSVKRVIQFSGHHFIWLTLWMSLVVVIYKYTNLNWIAIPWLPLSLIGTAVAFYVGFKNNSAYDRMWEARKIWGAIVNSSRSWATYINGFVSDLHATNSIDSKSIQDIKKRLIYRHISWLYALRKQLLQPTVWEHSSQSGLIGKVANRYIDRFGLGKLTDLTEWTDFISEEEKIKLSKSRNVATQLIDLQSQDLALIRKQGLIDDFRHMELQAILKDFYTHQGKCERIKKFPLPRQYASMSFYFVGIFIFLLPFGMISEFAKMGEWAIWLSIPFNVLVGWVFIVMELVGDYSENPFSGMANDIPMLSLCRVIETDLRQILGEEELPIDIGANDGILM